MTNTLQWLADQGATFALPKGRTKDDFPANWPNTPNKIDKAIAHAAKGGNVGLLVGKHSNNIVALDLDVDFPGNVAMLGTLASTAKVIRDNAPGRGKLLYRITGKLPKSKAWKPAGEKNPHAELLSTGRHALIEPSEFGGGHYLLKDIDKGILVLTPEQLNRVWWMVTGEDLDAPGKGKEQAEQSDEFKAQVKAAWPTIKVFQHFGLDANGTEGDGEQRLLGNGGLLVKDWRWYCHSEEVGGDQFDAWHYCKHGKTHDRTDKDAFKLILSEMADAAGIVRTQSAAQKKTVRTVDQSTGEIIESAAPDLTLTVDEVLQAISKIATTEDLKPGERKVRIVKELSFSIGALKRSDHALVIEALEMGNAGLTKTDATNYVRDCVADAKKRAKEEQRQRAERARANLLTVRSAKGKRSIDVGNRQLSEIVGDAMQAIRDDNGNAPTIFVRGGALARIAQDERGYYSIQEMSGRSLLSKLSQIADWETVSLDQNGDPVSKAVFPPTDAINAIMGAADWPGMPALAGVVNAPIFSSDGKLHDKPGYDSDTRHYYTGGVKVGNTAPIAPNIERAKDLILNNLLIDFPFKDEASRAHAVAYLLLPFVRDRIVGPTPVHTVDAPSAGTGKGLLLNACAYAFLGHEVPTMPAAKDDDEWRKRISSSLMSGNTHLVIDNVNYELDSGSLASAFTQPVWQDRVLGSNREIKIPVRCIWGITANNIKLSQELARRCIWIRLDANAEQPWGRDGFKHKFLISWVSKHRDELATAAITLIRAWIAKGQPLYTKRTKGSYEQWAGVMGGILEAVGITGFLDNEAALYERVVSKSNLLVDFVKAWWDKQKIRIENYRAEVGAKGESKIEKSLSSDELFKLASYAEHENDDPFGEYHNLLGDMLGDGRPRSRQIKLGRILSEHQDKVVGGYKILLAKTAKGMKYWRLEDATAAHSTQHSTQHSQVVEPSQVECGEYKAPYSVWEENIFIIQNTLQQSDDNKNNSLYSAAGVEHSPHSTQGTTNGTATGGSDWVECQNPHSTQTTHFTVDELIAKVAAIKGLSADEKAAELESEAVEVVRDA